MANVSLRIYNKEIENLVERGELDEAIAHCRHVLNTFPKNLETYRLVGKAYLEAKRYNEATDIFERLLMAVPDDFVAHVGMSIIRDEQKNLDAAIWHMQRAFEVQPSNAAIQAELQRLFGRRDGVEPSKIRLTRGALAHMYLQGELYPQAISEINSVLEEDRERQDMQVLLARAYFHSGQKNESAEMCSQLLRRYPYCLDANRVLIELLPETEHGESIQTYRNRVNEMDPYAAYATGSVFRSDEVADSAISLERLEWDGQPAIMGPAWVESQGIGRDEGIVTSGEEPDWLKTGLAPESPATPSWIEEPASVSGSFATPTAGGEDEIPEFLRAAGWGEDTGTFQEGSSDFDESSEEPGLAEGDLPDWVKAMAPTGADIESAAPQAVSDQDLTQDDVPDWLQGLGDAQSVPSAEQMLTTGEDMPDWLESVKPPEEVQPQPEEQVAPTAASDDIFDFLEDEEQALPQRVHQEPVLDAPAAEEAPLSDWQFDDEAPAGPVASDKTDTGSLGTSAEEQDDAIAWLEGLAAKHGAKPEELVTDPEVRKETEPDWVQQARTAKEQEGAEAPVLDEQPTTVAEEPALPVQEAPGADDLPDFLSEEQVEPTGEPEVTFDTVDTGELGASAQEQDDAVAWLEGLAAKHGAKPEELVTDPEARKETEPDWVQQARMVKEQEGAEAPVSDEQPTTLAEEPALPVQEAPEAADLPDFLSEEQVEPTGEPEVTFDTIDTGELGTSAQEQDDAVAWLEGLAAKHGAKPEELVTDPEARKETAPDWVQQASETGVAQPPTEEETALQPSSVEEPLVSSADADETGMWLHDLGEEGSFVDDHAEQPESKGDFTTWLDRLESEEAEPSAAPETEAVPDMEKAFGEEAAPEPVGEAEPEAPDWLRSLEAESTEVEPEKAPAEEVAAEDLPSWLADLDSDADETPAEPAVAAGDDLPDWLRAEAEKEDEPVQPEPTTPTDWQPVDAAEEPTPVEELPPVSAPAPIAEEQLAPEPPPPAPVEAKPEPEPEPEPEPPAPPEREVYREPVTRSRSGMTGMLSATQDPLLVEAQNELTRSNIPAAMENYGKLIKKGKMLDEVIFDLREALYRYPVEVAILQTLGDAYMRANRLQDALDSYTKAEELLR